LAEVLTAPASRGPWPVDWVVLPYFAVMGLANLWLWNRLPGGGWLAALNGVAILIAVLAIRHPGKASWIFRHWYPLPYVAWCYREMALLIPAVRGRDADAELARLDYRVWGANPTVWLERLATPVLTEYLQIVYALFVPVVLFIAFLLWRQRRYADFRYYAFLIALGFLVSYLGYLLVPARGPRAAGHPRPAGIESLGLLSERTHRTHHAGVVGQRADLEGAILGVLRLYLVDHFCYSLSSIPLYDRHPGRSCRGRSSGAVRAAFV